VLRLLSYSRWEDCVSVAYVLRFQLVLSFPCPPSKVYGHYVQLLALSHTLLTKPLLVDSIRPDKM